MKTKRTRAQKRKIPYKEGSVFTIPLTTGGYGLGVVARTTRHGLLGYFYGEKFSRIPSKDSWSKLSPEGAILKLLMGDLHFLEGSWKVLGELENFKREDWHVPVYIRRDPFSGRAHLVNRSDDNPDKIINETRVPFDSLGYWEDSLYGAGAVEIELTRAIDLGLNKPLPYQEGTVFAVPLKNGEYTLGVVARTTKVGEVATVYLFGEKFATVPSRNEWSELDPKNAIAKPRVLDISLKNGEWPIIGTLENWEKIRWPMPKYILKNKTEKIAKLNTFDDACPAERIKTETVPFETTGYEPSCVFGAPRIEDELSERLLGIPVECQYWHRLFE